MALTFYYASGSPNAWRVWLALERKGAPYMLWRERQLTARAWQVRVPTVSSSTGPAQR